MENFMIFSLITLGVVGAVYLTGDAEKKMMMREVDSEIAEIAKIAKDTALDIAAFTKKKKKKIHAKRTAK